MILQEGPDFSHQNDGIWKRNIRLPTSFREIFGYPSRWFSGHVYWLADKLDKFFLTFSPMFFSPWKKNMDPKTWRFGSYDFQFSNWVHFLDSMSVFSGVFSNLYSCMMINLYCKKWYDYQSSYFDHGFMLFFFQGVIFVFHKHRKRRNIGVYFP